MKNIIAKHKFKVVLFVLVVSVVVNISFMIFMNTYVPVHAFIQEQSEEYNQFTGFLEMWNIGYRHVENNPPFAIGGIGGTEENIELVSVSIRRRDLPRLVVFTYRDTISNAVEPILSLRE